MKLPKLDKGEDRQLSLGGHKLPFRRFKVSDFALISENKSFQEIKQDKSKIVVFILALLLNTEEDFETRLNWVQQVELDDITELFGVAEALGVSEKKIKKLQSTTPTQQT